MKRGVATSDIFDIYWFLKESGSVGMNRDAMAISTDGKCTR